MRKRNPFFLLYLILIVIWLSGFDSCPGVSQENFYSTHLPQLDQKVDAAILALKPPHSNDQERGLATAPHERVNYWTSWTEDRLKEVQNYLDALGSDPKFRDLRPKLSTIANDLVTFYGFCQQGNRARMLTLLEQMKVQLIQVKKIQNSGKSVVHRMD